MIQFVSVKHELPWVATEIVRLAILLRYLAGDDEMGGEYLVLWFVLIFLELVLSRLSRGMFRSITPQAAQGLWSVKSARIQVQLGYKYQEVDGESSHQKYKALKTHSEDISVKPVEPIQFDSDLVLFCVKCSLTQEHYRLFQYQQNKREYEQTTVVQGEKTVVERLFYGRFNEAWNYYFITTESRFVVCIKTLCAALLCVGFIRKLQYFGKKQLKHERVLELADN